MLVAEFSVQSNATPHAVWSLWSDVSNWKSWDDEVEFSSLEGPFQIGTSGTIKPRGGPRTKFIILDIVTHRRFHDRSYLPFARLDFMHSIEVHGERVLVTHRVEMTGVLTFLFSRLIGNKIKKGLPHAVAKLIAMAETRS